MFTYLGGLIYKGVKLKYFEPLVNKIRGKLVRWKSILFFMARQLM